MMGASQTTHGRLIVRDASGTGLPVRWLAIAGALLAAGLYAVACPPYEWSAAAWLAPGVLLVSTRRLRPGQAFLHGVLFAVVMSYGVALWVSHATLAYFGFNQLLAAGFALSVYLIYGGIPYGLLVLAYALTARRVPAAARAPLGACLWASSELLRANIFTGLPWELLGHTQFQNLLVVQIADVGGVYAVSFLIALVSVASTELLIDLRASRISMAGVARRLAVPAAGLAATLLYGVHSRSSYTAPVGASAHTVAIVQGNIENAFRWKRQYFERTVAVYAKLTSRLRSAPPDLVVWPENAVNFYIEREPVLRAQLGAVARMADEGLLVGGPRLGTDGQAYNSAYLIGEGGRLEGTYDKRRLVPFAEYDPLPWFGGKPSSEPVEYTAGTSAQPLHAAGLKLGTVICYEVLFPHLVRDLVLHGAEVLVNLSNDSWLDRGDGVAPRQHFSMSIFRAIETRRHLVRASAGGVSGFVSPYGAMSDLLPSDTAGTAVASVATLHELTPYVRWGDRWVLLAALLSLATLLRAREAHAS